MKFPFLTVILSILSIATVSAMTSGEAMVLFGAIFTMIMAVIFFLVISIMSRNVPVKIFFLSLSVIVLVATIGFGAGIMQQFFSDFATLTASYGAFYRLLTILMVGGGAALILWLIVVAFRSFYSYRGVLDDIE